MGIYKYEQQAGNIAFELRDSLSREDEDALRDDLRAMGESGWLNWFAENQETAFSILKATREARAKRKIWADPVQRRRICFAAFHLARLAELALSAASALQPGGSYRETCVAAAHACLRIQQSGKWSWPFDEHPPFETWQEFTIDEGASDDIEFEDA